MLRQLKLIYALYNFFHKKELNHNIHLYKKLALKKKYYSSISSRDFINSNSNLFLNTINKEVSDTAFYKNTSEVNRKSIDQFHNKGYAVLKNYLNKEDVLSINHEIDSLLKKKKIKYGHRNKMMFAFHKSKLIYNIGSHEQLVELISCLMKGNARLFSSINFKMGSEQDAHSDSYHMTTFPFGGLVGAWFALEDITLDNGPLYYYPESHKLPYYVNSDFNNNGNSLFLGNHDYCEYEKMIQEKIETFKLKKEFFYANSGDVLLWHANLLHGGEKHMNKSKSRKSMVFHYFNQDFICYHEITQRPALFKQIRF